MYKALPKKDKEEKTKKAPTQHASAKKTGKNGKTRYSYPADKDNDRKKSAKGGDKKKSKDKDPGRPSVDAAKEAEQAEYQPPPRIPQLLPIDPAKLAAQLGLSQETLRHVVHRFADHPKLGGRDGFAKFMLSQARAFCEKHGLDAEYMTRAFDAIIAADPDGAVTPATGV